MSEDVPHRRFRAYSGEYWDVWQVARDANRTLLPEPWLCFMGPRGERRRFAPVPEGWEHMDNDLIRFLHDVSEPVGKANE